MDKGGKGGEGRGMEERRGGEVDCPGSKGSAPGDKEIDEVGGGAG